MNTTTAPPPPVRVHGTFHPIDFLAFVVDGDREIPVRARRTEAGWKFRCGECGRQTHPRCVHVAALAQLTRTPPTERTTP